MAKSAAWLREQIEKIDKESGEQRTAKVHREQEWAKVYVESGLTHREIADVHSTIDKNGKKRKLGKSTVDRRLRFGRFLKCLPPDWGQAFPLHALPEGKFRGFWHETPSSKNENERFADVVRAIMDDIRIHKRTPNDIVERLEAKQCDGGMRRGKWYTALELAGMLSTADRLVRESTVKISLRRMINFKAGNSIIDKRKYKATHQYKMRDVDCVSIRVAGSRYQESLDDIRSLANVILQDVDGKTWANSSPESIRANTHILLKRIAELEQELKDASSSSGSSDVPKKVSGFYAS